MDRRLVAIQVLDERFDAAREFEDVVPVLALVRQLDADAGVQERQLAQALGERVVVEHDVREDRGARLETNRRARAIGLADDRERRLRIAEPIGLLVEQPVAVDRQHEDFGQRVDDGDADAVQTARNLVAVVVELTAGVEDGHDDLGRRAPLLGVDIDRNASPVVDDGDGFVGVDRDRNFLAVTGESLVDRVVDDLENHVVEARAVIGITDVHPRPFSDRFETL